MSLWDSSSSYGGGYGGSTSYRGTYSGATSYGGAYSGATSYGGGYSSSTGYGGGYGGSSGGYGAYSRSAQSSMLQSVIRNLVDSTDDEERMQQKAKLEDDLRVAAERLENLVKEHKDKLHSTLDTFEKIDSRVRESQEKIRALKRNLQSCKTLLRCKREELKRLWLEDVKYKHMLKLIDTIEEVKGVPEKLQRFRASKHFLQATELVTNTVSRLDGELATIEALRDLKQELIQQKERLHEEMIDELHRHLYVKSSAKKYNPRDPTTFGSSDAQSVSPVMPRRQTAHTQGTHSRSASRTLAMEKEGHPFLPPTPIKEDTSEVTEDLNADPEENSSNYMNVLIEALSILGKVEEALDAIGSRMKREFVLIVEKASIRVTRQAEQEAGPLGKRAMRENNPKLLQKLLNICFSKFHSVVQAHSVLLGHLQKARKAFHRKYQLYSESDVWDAIQHVLETTLEQYLTSDDEVTPQGGFTTLQGSSDVHSLFMAKRRPGRKGQAAISFRFDSSRHAISINTYMKEQRDLELAEGVEREVGGMAVDQQSVVQHLVCKQSKRNITVIFGPVREFVKDIESALCLQGKHCSLYHFLHDFVQHQFLDSLTFDCNKRLEQATKAEAARTTASDQKVSKIVGSKLQVLNSVIVMWQLVEDLRQLMKDLSLYSPHFLRITVNLLERYRDSCNSMYRELTVSSDGGKMGSGEYVVSSKWARDADINRMIRSLPSWHKLYQSTSHWSDEEGKQVAQESELLMSSLGTEQLRKNNVLLDHDVVKLLGILHESLDWFSNHLKQMVMELTTSGGVVAPTTSSPGITVTDGAGMSSARYIEEESNEQERQSLDLTEQLSKIQFDFQALAETTIIMLHLEVRCHCFYYLQPALHKWSYAIEPNNAGEDTQVKQLAFDLRSVEMVMAGVLTAEKLRYLFDGTGHLVASIFIGSTEHMHKINPNGIKKMCRNISVLQSCLSKITLIREKDLDRARRYYEMLYLNDEDILHQMYEQGAQFSQKDYINAFKLLAHSQPSYDGDRLGARIQAVEMFFSKDSV